MKKSLVGQKFSKLTVLEIHSVSRNGHRRYKCLCDCGNYANILGTHLKQGLTKSCGCIINKGSSHKSWKGFKEISGSFWRHHIIRSANGEKGRRVPVPLEVSIEDIWNLFIKQNRKCALSGIELKFPDTIKDKSYTASLDRIDSSKGYVKDNIQWVHKDINMMKNKFNNEYFINMCTKISNNQLKAGGCEVK